MILDYQVSKSSPAERVRYLLEGIKGTRDKNKVDILDGNPELFIEIAMKNPYSVKTHNYLISFAESKEELERKLAKQGKTIEELYEEILSFLLPVEYYPRESLNILAVGHADTDNYHIHLTIENFDHENQKSLYIPRAKRELDFYRSLEKYINAKYGLDFRVRARNKGKTGAEKIKKILEERKNYKSKTRDEVKEEITNYLTELVLIGEINSREELVAYLGAIEGIEIKRIGKNYISFDYEGQRYRLKGGIYDEERFREVVNGLKGERENFEEVAQLFETVRRERENLIGKRRKRRPDIGKGISISLQPSNEPSDERRLGKLGEENRRSKGTWMDYSYSLDWLTADYDRYSPIQTSFWRDELSSSLQADSSGRTEISLLRSGWQSGLLGKWEKMESISTEKYADSYSIRKLKELVKMRKDLREVRQQEIQLLKEIDPEEVLNALGIDDYREMDGYLLMSSPIREGDEHPSFAIFWGDKRNCWIYCDYGIRWAGSSIDLWQKVRNLDYVDAVREMRETFGINLLEQEKDLKELKRKVKERIEKQRKEQKEKRKKLKPKEEALNKIAYRILEVKGRITNPKLLDYLKKRGIHRIPSWLSEIRYKHLPTGKEYYGLAVRNYSGAWNVRSALEKGKYVVYENPEQRQTFTWIKRGSNNRKVVIVEGMFDALSLEQIARKDDYDIIILNGVGNYIDLLKEQILENYKTVILALDNDEAGRRLEEILIERFEVEGKIVKELAFTTGKDLNECLVKGGTVRVKQLVRPFYAGVVNHRLVISDDIEVLKKLKAIEIKRIEKEKDIQYLWVYYDCTQLEIYSENPEVIPKWIKEVKLNERKEVKPVLKKYWDIDGKLLLEDDIYQNPSLYRDSNIEEVRRLAEERISAQEKAKEIERRLSRREKNYGLGLGR